MSSGRPDHRQIDSPLDPRLAGVIERDDRLKEFGNIRRQQIMSTSTIHVDQIVIECFSAGGESAYGSALISVKAKCCVSVDGVFLEEDAIVATYLTSSLGGVAIGLSATSLLLLNGRIAGISGIVSGLWRTDAQRLANVGFVCGLIAGPLLFASVFGQMPEVHVEATAPTLVIAGLLVGYGTRLGSGCTSGHGVVGLARLSPRSIVAVAIFLACAIATVAVMRLAGMS